LLEQEIASIINFILPKAGNPSPYYREVPQDFLLPAAYFPVPEISSRGDTFNTYALEYLWFIKIFHTDVTLAYELAFSVLTAMQGARNLVPLIDTDGNQINQGVRLKDPSLRKIDGKPSVVQLELSWDSPRPYDTPEEQKSVAPKLNLYTRNAYDAAVKQVQDEQV